MSLAEFYSHTPWAFAATCGVLGLAVGSFLNVVIHRLPRMMERAWRRQCAELEGRTLNEGERYDLLLPPSTCPHCGHRLGVLENIPLLSYLWLRGRCRACATPIGLRYPLVEALTAFISAYTAWHFGLSGQAAAALLLVWALIALTFIDLDTQLLPDDLTLPLLWVGLLINLFGVFTDLSSSVIGAIAGYLSLWSIYWLFKLVTGKEGMGYGDFKLLAALGAWLGWQMLPAIVLLASLVGAAVGIALIVFARHDRRVPIPFGPYLAAGGLVALFWGKSAVHLYLGQI
ncbi:prepilin peptidase [Thiobacter aerophilum]|uniref:Prepilin leader peptidase/N-methyltransferase n=1 Tax=Thiobacter aerophilum TaxID=3121275 RepID=A0ABV0EF66_9BURK